MFKAILLVGGASVVAGALFTFGAVASGAVDVPPPVEVALTSRPVFPVEKPAKVVAPKPVAAAVPAGAQYRVRSGKSGFRYVACDRQRSYGGTAVEFGCLSWSKSKGWGKSIRWFGRYELYGLTGELPAAPVETAITGK